MSLCKCGCGQETNLRRGVPHDYLKGHWWRGKQRISGPDYIEDENGCWIWQHGKTPKGYGQAVRDGKVLGAHRWYYEQAKGPISKGHQLDHLCRVPACVNPDHLEIVDNTENVRRGSATRLTKAQVRAIKEFPREYGTGNFLAAKYGVSASTISAIRSGQNWADV
jgi:hypothetical protein